MYSPIFNRNVNLYVKRRTMLLGAFSLAICIVFYQPGV